MMKKGDALKLFGLNNLTIESEIRNIEKNFDIKLRNKDVLSQTIDDSYYPQFSEKLRDEALSMAGNYIIFYCLENSIRKLIEERLSDPQEFGDDWWEKAVPQNVKDNAKQNRDKEITSGVTLRSDKMIDYSNFGELAGIIKANAEIFGDTLRDITAVGRILGELNTLRAPIAHCKSLAPDEVLRLHLSLRAWFRQME